jgi:transketolase
MGLEDISLMRALPTMGVFQPADDFETRKIMDYLVKKWKGPAYLRLTRQNLPLVTDQNRPYEILKLNPVFEKPGAQVLIIGSGAGVAEALSAAKGLQEKGVAAEVWNAHCLKPFDHEGLLKLLPGKKLVVSVEDHSVIGGLGSCISDSLSKLSEHPRLIQVGVQDMFGESGEPIELYDMHGISSKKIIERVMVELKERF